MAEVISTHQARFYDFNVVAYRKPMATARGKHAKIPEWPPFTGFAPLETIESPACKSYIETTVKNFSAPLRRSRWE
jgi:hypothetical protein